MSGREAKSDLEVNQIYRLLQCVCEGYDTLNVQRLANLGVENLINLTEPKDGSGALHVAVSTNNDMVSFLLFMGVNPDIQDKKGRTAAMLAAELGNHSMLSLLGRNDANFSLQDTEGKGVLFYCIYPTKSHTRCVMMALKGQADVNNVSAEGVHVFQQMCENAKECPDMCLMVLDGGADPNAMNQETGVTALMEAAKAGSPQLVRAILKKGGNPNAMDKRRSTALHYAAMGGCFQVIQVLSAYSADMGVVNMDECTPLHYAATTGDANCCKFLAQRGCNPNLKNQEGLLVSQIAKDAGHKAAAKVLRKAEMQQGNNKETTDNSLMSDFWVLNLHDWCNENETELQQAFGNESDSVTSETLISVLEELKAPVELDQLQTVISVLDDKLFEDESIVWIDDFIKGGKYIKRPFLLSSYNFQTEKGCLREGAKGGNKTGQPLYMIEKYNTDSHPIMNDSKWWMNKPEKEYVDISDCVRSGDLESLALAFSKGVPVDVKDPSHNTPLQVACSSGNYEVAQYLLRRGADVNVCDQLLLTPLHIAAFAGKVELTKLLVDAGAPIDAQAEDGDTPLMRAIQGGSRGCVDILLKAGTAVDAKNKKGHDCLAFAKGFADCEIIDMVKEKINSLPKPKKTTEGKKGKAEKTKPAKVKPK